MYVIVLHLVQILRERLPEMTAAMLSNKEVFVRRRKLIFIFAKRERDVNVH